jgi:hypothetical protein
LKSVVRLKGSTRSLVSRYERLPFTVYYGLLCVLIFTHCAATAQSSQYSFLGKKELAQHDIYGIVQDFDNILYLTTNKGVVKYDGYSFSLIIQKPGIVGTSFFSPKVSAKGDVYCSNLYGQVLKVVGDSLTIYFDEESQQKSLKTNFVFMDNDEMLVMGLHLYKVTPTSDTMLYDELPIGTSYSNFYQESPSKISFYHSSGTGYVKISVLGGVQVEKINIPAREAVVFGLIDLQGQPLFYNQETTELVEGNDLTGYFTSERSINNGEVVRYYLLDDKLCVLNNTAGVRFFSKQCEPLYGGRLFLQDIFVSSVYRDREGNYLFGTFNSGIVVVANLNINQHVSNLKKFEEIESVGGMLYMSSGNKLLEVNSDLEEVVKKVTTNKIDKLTRLKELDLLIVDAKDDYILNSKNNDWKKFTAGAIKNVAYLSSSQVILASHIGLVYLNIKDLSVDSVQAIGRTNLIAFDTLTKSLYIVNANGLYVSDKDGKRRLRTFEQLQVNDILVTGGICYLATENKGVLFIRNGKICNFSESDTSMSDCSVSQLEEDDTYVYAHTNVGLLLLNKKRKRIHRSLSLSNGLSSEGLLDYTIRDNTLFLITDEGLLSIHRDSIYPERYSGAISVGRLQVNDAYSSLTKTKFAHTQSKFEFTIAAPSIRYRDEIVYEYKLVGLDDTYQTSSYRDNRVTYKSLPAGNYTFIARTVWLGNRGDEVAYTFEIRPPFWRTWWFYLCVVGLVSLVILLFYRRQIARIKRKNQLKNELNLSKLIAIQSQMNPHFIFNAINSIQGLILNERTEESYDYVVKFSQLVRQTLSFSNKEFISFEDELSLLEVYLDIEKLRFKNDFQFEIITNAIDSIELPPMLIQPFVENAIKHGLLHKEGLKKVKISFELLDTLICTITDNGVGREESTRIKDRQSKTHLSFSTNATAKRLLIMNEHYEQKVRFTYKDLMNEGKCIGTQVTILMPYKES